MDGVILCLLIAKRICVGRIYGTVCWRGDSYSSLYKHCGEWSWHSSCQHHYRWGYSSFWPCPTLPGREQALIHSFIHSLKSPILLCEPERACFSSGKFHGTLFWEKRVLFLGVQLRGRVGRADREAHAYMFHPRKELLSDDALVSSLCYEGASEYMCLHKKNLMYILQWVGTSFHKM